MDEEKCVRIILDGDDQEAIERIRKYLDDYKKNTPWYKRILANIKYKMTYIQRLRARRKMAKYNDK